MPKQKLTVIDEPSDDERSILTRHDPKAPPGTPVLQAPLFVAAGEIDLVCGACEHVLVQGAEGAKNQFRNLVFQCLACGKYNDTNDAPS